MKYEDFTVTAIVTAGINVNAVRVGDPTTWHERSGTYFEVMSGTINILLHIDADLAPGALVNALVTCTESKDGRHTGTSGTEQIFPWIGYRFRNRRYDRGQQSGVWGLSDECRGKAL